MRKRRVLRSKNRPMEKKQMIFNKTDPVPSKGRPLTTNPLAAPAAPAAVTPPGPAPAAAAPPAAAAGQGERQGATIRYVDNPEVAETFSDAITGLIFDGQTLRIEFGVTRFDDVKANTPITGRRYPACRVVLPPAAAVDLINRMQQITAALTQAGVVKAAPRPAEAPKAS